MRRVLSLVLCVVLLFGFTCGCGVVNKLVPVEQAERAPVDVLALVDNSASFTHRQEAVEVVFVPLLRHLLPGDRFIVRVISARSMPLDDLVNIRIPQSPYTFDASAEKERRLLLDEAEQKLRQFAVAAPKAQRTDLVGAIASIADVPRRRDVRRLLIVASDLHDTGRGPGGLEAVDLTGLEVTIVYVELDQCPTQHKERVENWREAFVKAGAEKVRFLSPTASRATDLESLLSKE